MGKARLAARAAVTSARQEPQNSWMKDLQLQTVCIGSPHWSQRAYQQELWCSFELRERATAPLA